MTDHDPPIVELDEYSPETTEDRRRPRDGRAWEITSSYSAVVAFLVFLVVATLRDAARGEVSVHTALVRVHIAACTPSAKARGEGTPGKFTLSRLVAARAARWRGESARATRSTIWR